MNELDYDLLPIETELMAAQKELLDALNSPIYSPLLNEKKKKFLRLFKEYWKQRNEIRRKNNRAAE